MLPIKFRVRQIGVENDPAGDAVRAEVTASDGSLTTHVALSGLTLTAGL